jgi:hypothetical protein
LQFLFRLDLGTKSLLVKIFLQSKKMSLPNVMVEMSVEKENSFKNKKREKRE